MCGLEQPRASIALLIGVVTAEVVDAGPGDHLDDPLVQIVGETIRDR